MTQFNDRLDCQLKMLSIAIRWGALMGVGILVALVMLSAVFG